MSDSTLKVLEAGVGGQDLGAILVAQGATPVKIGKQTVVDQAGVEVPFAKDATVAAVTTSLGTDGASPPAIPGAGVRGWLRSIYDRLATGVGRTWTLGSGTDSVSVVQGGAFSTTVSGTVAVNNFPDTQPVSGTVTANLGTLNGAATAANQTNVQSAAGTPNATALTVQGNAGGVPLPVSGPLTDTQLRATAVPVSGPLTDTQLRATAVPVSGTVSLGTGANSIGNIGTVGTITNPVSVTDNGGSLTVDGTVTVNQGTAGASAWPVSDGGASLTVDGTVSVANFPATQNVAVTGQGTTTANPLQVQDKSCDLSVTATGAAAAANTATLPAVAGQFHHITGIEILLYTTAARTASATPVTVTTTNFTSAVTFLFSSGGAVGGADRLLLAPDRPIRSATAGTATTIVCPATTGGLWHVKVFYYTSA